MIALIRTWAIECFAGASFVAVVFLLMALVAP